jgi:hypothetical protein
MAVNINHAFELHSDMNTFGGKVREERIPRNQPLVGHHPALTGRGQTRTLGIVQS